MKEKRIDWRNSLKFWNTVAMFYLLKNGKEGTINEMIRDIRCKNNDVKISLTDGFLYSVVIPILKSRGILLETNKTKKEKYLGRGGKIYKIDLNKLDEFIIKENEVCKRIYVHRIKTGEISADLDV